jgi:creatinine amidohydrolase
MNPFLPTRINSGPWLAGYSYAELKRRVGSERTVLPICSLGTPAEDLAKLAPLVLPSFYHEALDPELKAALLKQVVRCFPFCEGTRARAEFRGTFEIVELPRTTHAPPAQRPKVLAFSFDTAVEQHGPHLPLATDTLQSYAVLHALATEFESFVVGPPADYGHLTWGLPFGLSIDLTPSLTARYVRGFVNALIDWVSPVSTYVVDVHGSLAHRNAVVEGLRASRSERWRFRWLYDSLGAFTIERGDPHAGGVETALIERISGDLIDRRYFPDATGELAAGQMPMEQAIEYSAELRRFIDHVESHDPNGIIGEIRNYANVDANELFHQMLSIARADVEALM